MVGPERAITQNGVRDTGERIPDYKGDDMRLGLEDHDWKLIGSKLAHADDKEQTDFFRAFVKECKTWGTHYQVELQLAGVNRQLSDEEKDVLSMLGFNG